MRRVFPLALSFLWNTMFVGGIWEFERVILWLWISKKQSK
jgi:hypothetical protein